MPLKSTPITAPACVCVWAWARARARARARSPPACARGTDALDDGGSGDGGRRRGAGGRGTWTGDGVRTGEDGGAHDVDEVVADEGPVGDGVPPLRAQEKTTINYIDRNTLCSF